MTSHVFTSSGVALSFLRGGATVEISDYLTSDRYMVSHGRSPRVLGWSGSMPSGKCLNFGTLKRYFLHFEGTFEENIKV